MVEESVITLTDNTQVLRKDLQLGDYLARPIVLGNYNWTENTTFTPVLLDPWELLMANNAIKNKLTGYRWFRAKLKITVSISASPFLFSAMQVSYTPLDNLFVGGAVRSYGPAMSAGTNQIEFTHRSTQPYHGWVYPQEGTTLEFEVPFIYPTEWYDLALPPIYMGTLMLAAPNTLRTAGPPSTNVATISVVAAFVDPEVCGVTAALPQSGTAAGVSKDLKRLGFGTAAGWASVASSALRLMGLSNDAKMDADSAVVNKPFFGLTSSDIPVSSEPLSLGKGVHLSSEPDGSNGDELDIAAMCMRPAYLSALSWTITGTVGQAIGTIYVTPSNFAHQTVAGALAATYYKVAMSPACYVGSLFSHWRGTMCYKLKVICSQYHRGKLRIFYDSIDLVSSPGEAILPSTILDLSESTEVIIKVPMNSVTPWLETNPQFRGIANGLPSQPIGNAALPSATYSSALFNGSLRIEIMQKLSSPQSGGNALVYVEAWMEDAQFANPGNITNSAISKLGYTEPYNWQSGEIPMLVSPPPVVTTIPVIEQQPIVEEQSGNVDLGTKVVVVDQDAALTSGRACDKVYGEDVVSLRALLHRSTFYRSLGLRSDQAVATTLDEPVLVSTVIPRCPRMFGEEFTSAYNAIADRRLDTATSSPFNFVVDGPMMRLLLLFHGYKGSIRWRALSSCANGPNLPERINISRTNLSVQRAAISTATGSASENAFLRMTGMTDNFMGSATSNLTDSAITVDIPDYTCLQFLPTIPTNFDSVWASTITSDRLKTYDNIRITAQLRPTTAAQTYAPKSAIDLYVGACPDMRLMHYKAVPLTFYMPNRVAPNPDPTK